MLDLISLALRWHANLLGTWQGLNQNSPLCRELREGFFMREKGCQETGHVSLQVRAMPLHDVTRKAVWHRMKT